MSSTSIVQQNEKDAKENRNVHTLVVDYSQNMKLPQFGHSCIASLQIFSQSRIKQHGQHPMQHKHVTSKQVSALLSCLTFVSPLNLVTLKQVEIQSEILILI